MDATAEAGFGERTGLWQGIAARDVDGDGDIDYIVTNLGLNTRYQASSSAPFLCYYDQLTNNTRFLIPRWVRVSGLASWGWSRIARRLVGRPDGAC